MEQSRWNSQSGTVKWKSNGGTVKWNSNGGTVKVERLTDRVMVKVEHYIYGESD